MNSNCKRANASMDHSRLLLHGCSVALWWAAVLLTISSSSVKPSEAVATLDDAPLMQLYWSTAHHNGLMRRQYTALGGSKGAASLKTGGSANMKNKRVVLPARKAMGVSHKANNVTRKADVAKDAKKAEQGGSNAMPRMLEGPGKTEKNADILPPHASPRVPKVPQASEEKLSTSAGGTLVSNTQKISKEKKVRRKRFL